MMRRVMGYQVFVEDNYHYMDEGERDSLRAFESWEEAVACCREIVDRCLAELHEPGMTPEELWGRYTLFGEDPFIVPVSGERRFSAWSYAKERAVALCAPGEEA